MKLNSIINVNTSISFNIDLNEIEKAIINIKDIEKKVKVSNDLLEKEINYLGNSKKRIRELINQILIQKNTIHTRN